MANISQYHGEVKKCDCGIADHPEKQGERACRVCMGRGFVAACKHCDHTGKHSVPVNGHDPKLGMMSSTCNSCGGIGWYGVNKPADWVDAPVSVETGAEQTAAV